MKPETEREKKNNTGFEKEPWEEPYNVWDMKVRITGYRKAQWKKEQSGTEGQHNVDENVLWIPNILSQSFLKSEWQSKTIHLVESKMLK